MDQMRARLLFVVEPRVHRILAAAFARPAHGEMDRRHLRLDDLHVLIYLTRIPK